MYKYSTYSTTVELYTALCHYRTIYLYWHTVSVSNPNSRPFWTILYVLSDSVPGFLWRQIFLLSLQSLWTGHLQTGEYGQDIYRPENMDKKRRTGGNGQWKVSMDRTKWTMTREYVDRTKRTVTRENMDRTKWTMSREYGQD